MQRSLWRHTFSSPACVHAIESSDDGSRRSTMPSTNNEEPEPRKKMNKKVMKLLTLPLKHSRQRIPLVLRSFSWGATTAKKDDPSQNKKKNDGVVCDRERVDSDADTFVSANSSELRSFSTGVDVDDFEPPSFRLSPPPPIFPTGSIERPPPASPMKIVRKLPFGYVIGRQLDTPVPSPPPSAVTALSRKFKTAMLLMAWRHLRSRSRMVKKNVGRAFKQVCQRGRRERVEETHGCGNDDEDVFWKKDVKGLRCRRVQDDDVPY
ncbi:uncharacterized protein LOC8066737 [Sorghum bicolor]|uniref:Uncharacterized protein n=1 Tax=Sorghum bicolor TaxID=4558 RepID=C5YVL9_SORBI|nr:uncharacterized protein LOC8066737 [Sorghum bicolor]EES17949.1 hypothetical protein SORBI_3009G090900 [Sorghum bicolor]|eukprot:XP_002439519.1 uncharacterized protein LOC8066737 [Sorghum bicolor]